MQEYFNIDIEGNLNLGEPQEINNKKGEAAILPPIYNIGNTHENNNFCPITIMTPPLRCSKVRVWPGKNNKYSKCVIELETTENEWRFTQFLTDLSGRCRYIITENAKNWFKYAFSASSMRDSYSNIFVKKNYNHNEDDKIEIQLGKLLLNDMDKQQAKSYRNQYLVLRLVFKGVLICKGVFSEIWRADQIFKAKPNINESEDSEYDDDYYEDIGETIMVKNDETSIPENEKEIKTNESSVNTSNTKLREKVTVEKIDNDTSSDNTHENNTDVTNNEIKYVDENIPSVTMTVNEVSINNEENISKNPETEETFKEVNQVKQNTKSNTPKTKRKKKIIISNNRKRKW